MFGKLYMFTAVDDDNSYLQLKLCTISKRRRISCLQNIDHRTWRGISCISISRTTYIKKQKIQIKE